MGHSDMGSDWDGRERRIIPYRYELMEEVRGELDARDEKLLVRLDKIAASQQEIGDKIRSWEAGAALVRWLTISTVALITGGFTLYEKIRSHIIP